jgi:hypothetical protein
MTLDEAKESTMRALEEVYPMLHELDKIAYFIWLADWADKEFEHADAFDDRGSE